MKRKTGKWHFCGQALKQEWREQGKKRGGGNATPNGSAAPKLQGYFIYLFIS